MFSSLFPVDEATNRIKPLQYISRIEPRDIKIEH